MNNDLISRKAVIESVDRHTRDDGTLDDDISVILEEVETAFDKEKVIEEIQNQLELSDTCAYESDYPIDVSYYKGRALGHEIDIEIVEKGGIE